MDYSYRPFPGENLLELDYSQRVVAVPGHFSVQHHEKICKVVLTFVLATIMTLKRTMSKHGKQMVVRNFVG